jgi:Zn-dependent protease
MEVLIPLVVLIFSAILHEIMHGVVSDKLGDHTARHAGRLTLNPIPHIDPIMSVALPVLMLIGSGGHFAFGAAKPVPINPINFKDPLKDMALTALAGPLTNVFLAVAAAQLLKILPASTSVGLGGPPTELVTPILYAVVVYNLMLAILNMIPIPPLDGSRLVAALLGYKLATSYLSIERYGIFILLVLMFFPVGGFSLGDGINRLIIYSIHLLGI